MKETNYITTPIFYVNDVPHIGHAYTESAADVIARWSRQHGVDTRLLAGTDEHGEKILRTAIGNDMTPKEWVDRLVEGSWKPLLRELDISEDDFIRTTEERHEAAVRAFLVALRNDGYIYEGIYEGYYCVGCEEYKQADEYQEREGQVVCLIHGRPLDLLREKNYFFKLSEFAAKLHSHYTENPWSLQPEPVRNEILSFLSSGVRDISITRSSFDWGIKVPWDKAHVVYVWFDALINYISAVGWNANNDEFERWWPATHIVGKDIARLHAVLWPAMLLAAGLPLPKTIFGHGWLLVNGEKMSKTKLTGISPSEVIETFGSDAFRYYFLRTVRFGQDGSFTWADMATRYNSELANGLGNLSSRVCGMIGRYVGGHIPAADSFSGSAPNWTTKVSIAVSRYDVAMKDFRIHDAVAAAWSLVDGLNQYITERAPWTLAKDADRTGELAALLMELRSVLLVVASLLFPVMPAAMGKLWSVLGAESLGRIESLSAAEITGGRGLPEAVVSSSAPLFPRIKIEETSIGSRLAEAER